MTDDERSSRLNTRVSGTMKWLGVIAALISFGGAVYKLADSAGELRARHQQVQQSIATAQAQWQAGDYSTAWDTLARAEKTAAADGVVAKLLGGSSSEQQAIRTRQQDLAMEWVRSGRVPPGQDFASMTQKLIEVLASGATSTLGTRSADLHAHLGWAYFLEQRDGNRDLKPQTPSTAKPLRWTPPIPTAMLSGLITFCGTKARLPPRRRNLLRH